MQAEWDARGKWRDVRSRDFIRVKSVTSEARLGHDFPNRSALPADNISVYVTVQNASTSISPRLEGPSSRPQNHETSLYDPSSCLKPSQCPRSGFWVMQRIILAVY